MQVALLAYRLDPPFWRLRCPRASRRPWLGGVLFASRYRRAAGRGWPVVLTGCRRPCERAGHATRPQRVERPLAVPDVPVATHHATHIFKPTTDQGPDRLAISFLVNSTMSVTCWTSQPRWTSRTGPTHRCNEQPPGLWRGRPEYATDRGRSYLRPAEGLAAQSVSDDVVESGSDPLVDRRVLLLERLEVIQHPIDATVSRGLQRWVVRAGRPPDPAETGLLCRGPGVDVPGG
jgi:hypothetical protein